MAYYASSIDDNDSDFIYSGGWDLVTQDVDWRGTMHSTSIPGSYARVRFTGSRVAGVFTIPTGNGNSIAASFSIDNGPAVTRSRATTGPVQWNYFLFDSGPLPYGDHLLIITNVAKDGYLRIDRIDYDPTPNSAPSSAPPVVSKTATAQTPPATVVVTSSPPNSSTPPASLASSSTPSATGSNPQPAASSSGTAQLPNTNTNSNPNSTPVSGAPSVPTSQPTATPTSPVDANVAPSTATGTQSKSSGPSAALIGGVLGAVVVILLILLAGIFIVRRRRKHARHHANSASAGSAPNAPADTVPTPFDISVRNISSMQLVSHVQLASPSTSGTDYSSPTSDMYTSGQPSTSMSASLAAHHRPDVAFDSTMMASSKHTEYLQESQTSAMNPGVGGVYLSYGAIPQRLSAFTDYVPPPAYQ